MGCNIKVLVNNYVDGKLQTQEQTLLKILMRIQI